MAYPSRIKVLAVVFLGLLMVTSPGEPRRIPQLLCDFYRGLFLFYGCVDRRTHICDVIYNLLTRRVNHVPACDYFACSGYGRHVGNCASALFCLFTIEKNGICNLGRVCCRNLLVAGAERLDNSTLIDGTPGGV